MNIMQINQINLNGPVLIKNNMKSILLIMSVLLMSGCTTYEGVKPYAKYQIFPYSNGNMPSVHSTPVYGRVTVSDSKGNTTTYKISGYVR